MNFRQNTKIIDMIKTSTKFFQLLKKKEQ